jgi:hypothetical protein
MLIDMHGSWIVKADSDAVSAVVTEIDLSTNTATVRLENVASFAEDPALRALVDQHMSAVRELAAAILVDLPAPVSSKGSRMQQTSFGTLLCSRLRDALGADACLFNGGGIRGARDYPTHLTYGDIETEIPFDNELVVAQLTGRVVREAIAFSRSKGESAGFLQVDDRTAVGFDPDRLYSVAIVRQLMFGLDHIDPLVRWAAANPTYVPAAGAGREPKVVLIQAFAREIWRSLGGFDQVDTNHDERVTPSELGAAMALKRGVKPSQVLVDIVMRAIDVNGDRMITRDEA